MIKMVTLLQSRGRMNLRELSEELEVSERQIRTYRNDLEMGGIFITSNRGKYGGYQLESSYLNYINLTLNEVAILNNVKEQLKYDKNMYALELESIYHKVNSVYKQKKGIEGYANYFVVENKANAYEDEVKQKYYDINMAIVTKKKIKIEYKSINSGISERIVRPYGMYTYKGDLYFMGYCEKREDILDFKICRILSMSITNENFEIPKDFSLEKYYINCIGIFKEEEIDIKLKVKHPFSVIISEKIWVDNQKIKDVDDNTIIFEATMRGYTEIKSWILSMGHYVEVLSPKRLIDDIKKEINDIQEMY